MAFLQVNELERKLILLVLQGVSHFQKGRIFDYSLTAVAVDLTLT